MNFLSFTAQVSGNKGLLGLFEKFSFLALSVRSIVLETERLVESRRLLEAHVRLMDLEQWQDDILWQLYGPEGTTGSALTAEDQELVAKYFSGVGKLVDALGKKI